MALSQINTNKNHKHWSKKKSSSHQPLSQKTIIISKRRQEADRVSPTSEDIKLHIIEADDTQINATKDILRYLHQHWR